MSAPTANEHLKGIYDDGELDANPTIRKLRMFRLEGKREVAREMCPVFVDVAAWGDVPETACPIRTDPGSARPS